MKPNFLIALLLISLILCGCDMKGNNIGSTIKFGSYPQNSENPEPIVWKILDKTDGAIFIVPENALDCRYYSNGTNVVWDNSDLREWLNDYFYNKAFNEQEKARIIPANISTPPNMKFGISGGRDTEDRIFCLSVQDAEKYMPSPEDRLIKPTPYAVQHGAKTTDDGCCRYWLRTPGRHFGNAVFVSADGEIDLHGDFIKNGDKAVFMGMWIAN